MSIFPSGLRTTNPETRTEGRRPEQPINQARSAIRAQGKGLSFLTEGPSDRSRGNDFPCAGIVWDRGTCPQRVFTRLCLMLPLSVTLRGFGLLVVYTRGFSSRQSRAPDVGEHPGDATPIRKRIGPSWRAYGISGTGFMRTPTGTGSVR